MRNALLLTIIILSSGLFPAHGQVNSAKQSRVGKALPPTSADNWLKGEGNWSDAGDWSAGVPTSSSAVNIGSAVGAFVFEDLASASAASLSIVNGSSLRMSDQNTLTVGGSVTVSSGSALLVDDTTSGGATVTIGGSYANSGLLKVGASTVSLNGAFSNSGTGEVALYGGNSAALLSVAGASPSTLTGTYQLFPDGPSVGSAAVEFGSGGITRIGDGTANKGYLLLGGSNAYMEVGATNSNSALAGLNTIASNGELNLGNGATVVTNTGLTVNAGGVVKVGAVGDFFGSTLTIGGAYVNNGSLGIGGDSTVNVNGAFSNSGTGGVGVVGPDGGNGAPTLLNVAGPVPSTLIGQYLINGSAVLRFGSGGITSIGDGASNPGYLSLTSPYAYVEIGTSNSNNALATLSTIAGNGTLVLSDAPPVTTTGSLSVSKGGQFQISSSPVTIGGAYANSGLLQIGASTATSATAVYVNGAYSGTGTATVDLYGGANSGATALLSAGGAAPSSLAGTYNIIGSQGSTAINFGSGGIISIGDGSSNPGYLWLSGPNAYAEVGATNSNSALATLSTIASNGTLRLTEASTVATSGGLTVNNGGQVLIDDIYSGDSTLTVGGAYVNSGLLQVGHSVGSLVSTVNVSGSFSNNSTGLVELNGGYYSGANAVLNLLGGSLNNTGTINLNGGHSGDAILQLNGNLSLTGAGNVILSNSATNLILPESGNPTLTTNNLIEGSGTIENIGIVNTGTLLANQSTPLIIVPSSTGLNNQGTLEVIVGDTMQIGTSSGGALKNFSGTTLTGGTYLVNGTLQFGGSGTSLVTNAANITLTGPKSQIIDFSSENVLSAFATNASTGSFTLANSRNFITAGNFTNNGVVNIGSGTKFDVNGNLTNFSSSTLTAGMYQVAGTLQFENANIVTNAANITLTGSSSQIVDQNSNNALANFATNAVGGSFALAGGRNFTTAGNFRNTGALTIGSGSTFLINGNLLNVSGTKLIGGTYTVVNGTLQFGAPGTKVVTSYANITLQGTNSQIIDSGGGNILSALAVNAAEGGSLTVTSSRNFTTAGNFTNNGILIVGSGSTFDVNGSLTNISNNTLNNGTLGITGILKANGANIVTNDGTITLISPTSEIVNQTGNTNALANFATNNGSFSLIAGQNFTAGNFTQNGTLNVGSGSKFDINGNLANFSSNTLTGGVYGITGTLQFDGANIITNNGAITLIGPTSGIIDQSGNNGLASFAANSGSFTVTAGRNFATAGNFTQNGTLNVGSGSTFAVNGNLTNFSSGTLSGGTYGLIGTLQFNGASIATNAANITLTGMGARIIDQSGKNALSAFTTNASTGSFALAGSQDLTTTAGSFTNNGGTMISDGSTFTVGNGGNTSVPANYTQAGGTTKVDGTLTSAKSSSTPTLTLTGGLLDGSGTLAYTVIDAGTLSPGESTTSVAALKVTGPYSQTSGGALNISVGGATAGTQYDQLNVTGAAGVNGTLNVSLVNGYIPQVGSTYTILNASSLTGTFSTVNGVDINSSEHFAVTYNGNDVVLTVVSGAGPKASASSIRQLLTGTSLGNVDSAALYRTPVLQSAYQPAAAVLFHQTPTAPYQLVSVLSRPAAVSSQAAAASPQALAAPYRPAMTPIAQVPVSSSASFASPMAAGTHYASSVPAHGNARSTQPFLGNRTATSVLADRNRLEYGLNLLPLFSSNPKQLMKGFMNPGSPNAAGFVSFSGSH